MTKTNWLNLPEKITVDENFGFIYLITNTLSGKKYIGKKQFHFYRKVLQPGAKRKKTIITESDWQTYTGSSTHLNADIKLLGKDKFRFEIIHICVNKGHLHYMEVDYQVKMGALTSYLPDGNRAFYNARINAVKFIPKLPGSNIVHQLF